jgi:hypothetical protein
VPEIEQFRYFDIMSADFKNYRASSDTSCALFERETAHQALVPTLTAVLIVTLAAANTHCTVILMVITTR